MSVFGSRVFIRVEVDKNNHKNSNLRVLFFSLSQSKTKMVVFLVNTQILNRNKKKNLQYSSQRT